MLMNSAACIFAMMVIAFIACQGADRSWNELEEKNKELTFLSCHNPLTKLLDRKSMGENHRLHWDRGMFGRKRCHRAC